MLSAPTVIWLIAFVLYYIYAVKPKTPKSSLPGIFKKLLDEGKIAFPNPKEQLKKDLAMFGPDDHKKAEEAFEFMFGQCRDLNVEEVILIPDPISCFDYMTARGHKLNLLTGRYYTP